MAISKTKARKKIVIIMYQVLLHIKNNITYDIDEIINSNMEENDEYVENTVKNIINKIDEYTNLANKYLKTWPMDRLGIVDNAIILLAIYELIELKVDPALCINEAVMFSKVYSDDNVNKIINATLDSIYNNEVKK